MNINKTIDQLIEVKDKLNTIPQWKSKDRHDMPYLIGEVEKAFPKNKYGIKFNMVDDSEVSPNTIQISGLFHAKDKYSWIPERPRRVADIFITVHYNPKNNYNIKLTKKNYNQFLFRLYATISLEMIHRSQWSRIRSKDVPAEHSVWYKYYSSNCNDAKKRDEQEYLGSHIEIDAYAHDYMLDLNRASLESKYSPLQLLRKHKTASIQDSVLDDYLKLFDHDFGHPVIKSFLERTRFWIKKYNSRSTK
jgi:hypothetical protein